MTSHSRLINFDIVSVKDWINCCVTVSQLSSSIARKLLYISTGLKCTATRDRAEIDNYDDRHLMKSLNSTG